MSYTQEQVDGMSHDEIALTLRRIGGPLNDDARCPGCGKPASRTLMLGWLWRCDPCKWEWGHPQGIDRVAATQALHTLRAATHQEPIVRRKGDVISTSKKSSKGLAGLL